MTNTTNLAVQTMQQVQTASAPKAEVRAELSAKSFRQVMLETAQQAQQSASAQPEAASQPSSTTDAQPQQTNVRMLDPQQNVENGSDSELSDAQIFEILSGMTLEQPQAKGQEKFDVNALDALKRVELEDSSTIVKSNFLASLFGEKAVKGVDMEQSDMEILKDVYKNLTDPAAQFAMMLLMAFMQDNPDVSIMEVQSALDADAWSNPDVSPMQKVFSAITKMMQSDDSLKSSDTLDLLMQMARGTKTSSRVAKPYDALLDIKELEMLLMPQTNVKQTVNRQGGAQTEVQDPAVLLQQGQTQFKDAVTQARQMMQSSPNTPLATDEQAQNTGGTGQKRENGTAIDVEKLQAQVDAGSYLRNTSHQIYQLRQAGAVVTEHQPEIDPMELVNQVRTGILSGVSKGENEFVLKLRPEGLGELTIHLVETGAKISLSIVASSAQTQKLLTGELANLQAVMKPLNVEVQPVTTSEQASSSTMEQSMLGQFAQQQFGEHHHNGQFHDGGNPFYALTDEAPEQELETAGYPDSVGTSALDTYI